MIIGSQVSMTGERMLLGAAETAKLNHSNAFMVYTGSPQNSKRKPISDYKIKEAHSFMRANKMKPYHLIVHAPYILNLGNSKNKKLHEFSIKFLKEEITRAESMGATQVVLHSGSHIGEGVQKGIAQIVIGLNEVLNRSSKIQISLETMSGRGTEIGSTIEEISEIISGVKFSENLSVTFDTCHLNDAGYDIKNDFDGVLEKFDKLIGIKKLKVIHLNDSKNVLGSRSDRHENIGFGRIGFDSLNYIAHHPQLEKIPKILETPFVSISNKISVPIDRFEIDMLKKQKFTPELLPEFLGGYI
ncbi:deoxyribonuclease IV [Enterococcus entomosocium]|uniref:deoxyribonuclease IV n=1 Tax=Enterococcus entomosocium TaxID=3034352 RepID=UPI003D6A1030